MSNTNLPPDLVSQLAGASLRFSEITDEIGKQLGLTKEFNKSIEKISNNFKALTEVKFKELTRPLNDLKKSIDRLNVTVGEANRRQVHRYHPNPAARRSAQGGGGGGGGSGGTDPLDDFDDNQPRKNKIKEFFKDISKLATSGAEATRDFGTKNLTRVLKDNVRSTQNLALTYVKSFNVMDNLVNHFRSFEQRQAETLSMGVSYNKLLTENSEFLGESRVGLRELREAMVSNLLVGIKEQTPELKGLTEHMIATGQNLQGLQSVNTNLLALTGRDVRSMNSFITTNQEISDAYQISNDRLIQTMMSLSDHLEQAAFFGTDAVNAMGALGMELQAKLGVDMPREIATVMKMLTPSVENLARHPLLGMTGTSQKFAEGTLTLGNIEPMLHRVLKVYDESRSSDVNIANQLAASRVRMSEQEFRQLKRLADGYFNGVKTDEAIKSAQEEEFKQTKIARQKANDFFERGVQTMIPEIQKIAPALAQLTVAVNLAGLAGGMGGLGGKLAGNFGKAGLKIRGGVGLASMAAYGALRSQDALGLGGTSLGGNIGATVGGIAGSFIPIPLVGTIVGAMAGEFIGKLIDPVEEIRDHTKTTANATKDQSALAQQERRERLAAERRRETNQMIEYARYLRTYLPAGGVKDFKRLADIMERQNILLKDYAEKNFKTVPGRR
jgi:hypothetical protein